MDNNWKIETLAVQSGYDPENGGPRVAPLVQSTTFRYDDAQSVADLFDLKREGFFYTRLANPTVDVLEKKMAALEGGVAAVATSAGQTANTLAIMNSAMVLLSFSLNLEFSCCADDGKSSFFIRKYWSLLEMLPRVGLPFKLYAFMFLLFSPTLLRCK